MRTQNIKALTLDATGENFEVVAAYWDCDGEYCIGEFTHYDLAAHYVSSLTIVTHAQYLNKVQVLHDLNLSPYIGK